jgi:hypothetical protein
MVAGVIGEILPHDIRRGSARDVAHLPVEIRGIPSEVGQGSRVSY